MATPWSPFYWGDYIADTGHLSLAAHGAYVLLMAHYYRTRRPLDANASVLHRVCRCTTDSDKLAVEQVLAEFFVLDGQTYRHHRIDHELIKAAEKSEVRRAAANVRHHGKPDANALQMHTQPQPQPQPQKTTTKKHCGANAPSLEVVTAYCSERGNHVDPQQWMNHYQANGWKVGRNPMRDWKASIRTWESNEVNGNGQGHRTQTKDIPSNGNGDNGPDLSTYTLEELHVMRRTRETHGESVPVSVVEEIERRTSA